VVGEALPVLKGDNESAQFRGVNFIDGGGKAVVIQKLTILSLEEGFSDPL
jgi:hypothetical protein